MKELGQINHVDPRTVWQHEASTFTPWLADNLDRLSAALGLDLELTEVEAPVGDFSLDLLARDLSKNRIVIIENQLEGTDHDHLGKLLTYASGHDAGVIVWIATKIRDEHRQAMDWLNARTDSETEFFAVLLEVLQIDDSKPAVQFRPVAAPNTWRKDQKRKGAGQSSPRGELYRVFWRGVVDELREKHRFTRSQTAPAQNWCSFTSGVRGVGYNPSFAAQGRCRAEIYIDTGDEDENTQIFSYLENRKAELEQQFGSPLEWEALEAKRACRVAIYRKGAITDPVETHEEMKNWFIQNMLQLKRVLGPSLEKAARTAS